MEKITFFLKKHFIYSLFLLPIFLGITVSCNKENSQDLPTSQFSVNRQPTVKDICLPVANKTDITNTTTKHLKYYLASKSPYIYFPEEHRSMFQQKFDSTTNFYKNYSFEATIDDLVDKGGFSEQGGNHLKNIAGVIRDNIDSNKPNSFYFAMLTNADQGISTDAELSCTEREILLEMTATFRSLFTFLESENKTIVTFLENTNGARCNDFAYFVLDVVKYTGIGSLTGGTIGVFIGTDVVVGSQSTNAFGDPTTKIGTKGPGTLIGMTIGFLVGVSVGLLEYGNECDELCRTPKIVSYLFTDCTPTATVIPAGFGSGVGSLLWNNNNANPLAATTTPANPGLLVSAINPNIISTFTIATNCENVGTPFSRNLNQAKDEVAPYGVSGSSIVYDGKTYNYTLQGVAPLDGRHSFTFSVQGGTIISTTPTSIKIKWDLLQDNEEGKIIIHAYNNCPAGQNESKDFLVKKVPL
jgi:hypothetical protein